LGEHFILLNEHNLVPLRYQFDDGFGNAFSWEYLRSYPREYRVKIRKLAALPEREPASPCAH